MKLVLASASPRRAELLRQLGFEFEIGAVEIDETPLLNEFADAYVIRMARQKVVAAWDIEGGTDRVLLAADTIVVVEDQILGKPKDLSGFEKMMRLLSDREHYVMTSVAIVSEGQDTCFSHRSTVQFSALTDADIHWYWRTGEPQDKAGGYGIQGLGACFIRHISGSYSSIVGLPLYETAEILGNFGIQPNS